MLNYTDKSLAPTINEQSNYQEPMKLLQETHLCGASLSVYGTPIEPLFLAKQVAEIIDHSNHRAMLDGIDEDEKGVRITYTPGGPQKMCFLTEQGLYEVLMQSRKPIAKDFKRGVKNLLKGIRTGEYYLSNTFVKRTNRLLQSAEDRMNTLRKAIEEVDQKLQSRKESASLTAPIEEESFLGLEPILYKGRLWYRLQEVLQQAGMVSTPHYIKNYPSEHIRYCGNLFVSKRLGAMIYHRYQINRRLEDLATSNPLGLETGDDKDAERSVSL